MKFSTESIKKISSTVLDPFVEFVFLMGSAATERFHDESDIDLAVFWKNFVDEKQKIICLQDLEDQFGRDVDLVPLNKVDPIFARQVLENGRLILNHSPGILLKWKMDTLSVYPDFKFSRKNIEDNILNRKKYV